MIRTPSWTLVLVLAACGGGSPAPVGNVSQKGSPTGPAPAVKWSDEGFGFVGERLPAISADGSIVVGHVQVGGGGPPGVHVIVRDGNDAIVHKEVGVEGAEEPERADLTSTNRYLATLHAERDLRPLPAATVQSDGEGRLDSTEWTGGLGAVSYTYAQETGRLTVTGGGASIDRVMDGWLSKDYPMCEDCEEMCSNPPVVEGAWIDEVRKVAVLLIGYVGDDTCWEPDSEPHVVAW